MTKIKTYKTKRKETIHILSSLMSNLKSARMYKWRRVVPSLNSLFWNQQAHIVISISFHIPYTILSTLYFHIVLSTFPFLFYWWHLKVSVFPSSHSSLFRKSLTIGQSNVQAATAENEERYTLSSILNTAFQNFYSFLSSFLWSRCSESVDNLIENYL